MIIKNNFYIITGGPGVGKTTLLNEFQKRDYRCVPEVARNIIKEQMNTGGNALPWEDARLYSDLMRIRSVQDFIHYSGSDELLFFDRGIPDTYGYEALMDFDMGKELFDAVCKYRYNSTVFILPPWKEIYETDDERKQNFQTAVDTYHVMKESYIKLGYVPIDVPLLPVKERVAFVLSRL